MTLNQVLYCKTQLLYYHSSRNVLKTKVVGNVSKLFIILYSSSEEVLMFDWDLVVDNKTNKKGKNQKNYSRKNQ